MDEFADDRQKARGALLARMRGEELGYDSTESYGMSNDSFGPRSEAPLPYIPPTAQTEDGFVGLEPPMSM